MFYYHRQSVPIDRAGFGPGNGPILMDTVRCDGTEIALDRCSYSSQHNCDHDEDAGVVCCCTDDGLYNNVLQKYQKLCYNKVDNSNNKQRINMKFLTHITLPIHTFHCQNFTQYHVRLVSYLYFL